jgi:hypothetical protein
MKAKLKRMLTGYSGKLDGLVFYRMPGEDKVGVRLYSKPRITQHNHNFGAVTRNLAALQPGAGFLEDLRVWKNIYNRQKQDYQEYRGNARSLYTRIMWRMAKLYSVDIARLTREEIAQADLPCRSVKRAVEAGLLPEVRDYELLDREF